VPSRATSLVALTASVVLLCSSGAVRGADADRDGTREFFFIAQYALGDEQEQFFPSVGESASLEYEDAFNFGPGFGYNFSDHLNLNGSVLFGSAGIIEREPFGGSSTDSNVLIAPELNLDWNILDDTFTPFVTGGAGAMYFPGPFGGSIELSYGAGGGVRWDFADDAFLKVWYRAKWFDFGDADDTLLLHTFNVSIGIMR
jgi:hypothetical protein